MARDVRINVSLTADVKDKLELLALLDRTSAATLASKILTDYVAAREEIVGEYLAVLNKFRVQKAESEVNKIAGYVGRQGDNPAHAGASSE